MLTLLWMALDPDARACDRHESLPSWEEARPPVAPGGVGSASLSRDELPVHAKVSLTYSYTVGPGGIQAGDVLRLEDPLFHGMRWAKWGHLSTLAADCSPLSTWELDSSGGLVTVAHTGSEDAVLSLYRNLNGPELDVYAYTEVTLESGALSEGDVIQLSIGDTAGGEDCGLQTSNRAMSHIPWPILERLDGASEWTQVEPVPTFAFVPTDPPVTLMVTAPSQALLGEPVEIRVTAMDPWGNAQPSAAGTAAATLDGREIASHTFSPSDGGIWVFDVTFEAEGVERIQVELDAPAPLSGTSNPTLVGAEAPDLSIYWGDIHTHHGHSYVDEGGQLQDENHLYARDVMGLQVGCESIKASPQPLGWEALWPEFQQTCEDYTEDGAYVALLCFEWMGNQNSPGYEGHHNVYYDDCEGLLGEDTMTGLTGSDVSLWAFMAEVEATTGSRSLSVPHATPYTGFNWRDRDDAYRPLAEVYSEWGVSATSTDMGSGVYDGLAAGHRMGMFACSDNHDGWLGNRFASFYAAGGLGAYVATDLSRAAIFSAMQGRSTYGTTGHRPALRFEAEDGGQVQMGWEYIAQQPTFRWLYAGEATVQTVELLSVPVDAPDPVEVEVLASWSPGALDTEGEFTYKWDGRPRAVWLHTLEEGEEQAWSSPIWLTDDCEAPNVQDPAGLCDGDSGDSGGDDGDGGDGGDDTDVNTDDSGGDGGGDSGGDKDCGCGGGSGWLLAPLWLASRRRRRPDMI